MKKFSAQDIEQAAYDTVSEWDRLDSPHTPYRPDGFPWKDLWQMGRVHLPGIGWLRNVETWNEVVKHGVYQESTKHVMVFKVDGDERLFRKDGWRDSWDNYDNYDGPVVEVERYEKVVIAYREVEK
jgi:hypothetical protein